jgi:NAD(P)-dependent dehydrogenase (short-subunit alcohol dehydrogenase family)
MQASGDFQKFTKLLRDLPSDEREIRRMRKECKAFDEMIGTIYQFVQVDKIRAKAVREFTQTPRHIRKGKVSKSSKSSRQSRMPDIGPIPETDDKCVQDGHRRCYMCQTHLTEKNASEGHCWLCLGCDEINTRYLTAPLDLQGKFAVVTGGRVKVGFHIALRLLRGGAIVAVSSRFPADTLTRYQAVADYQTWRERLHIIGADFRSLLLLEQFVARIRELTDHVHILVNNAAQTVRRPAIYYKHLQEGEARAAAEPLSFLQLASLHERTLPLSVSLNVAASGPLEVYVPDDFPEGQVDIDGQQLDLRRENSWTQPISKVHIAECLETQVINSVAPFYIIQQLEPLFRDSFIINITSSEGRKGPKFAMHPHNNMSKAALNMLTQTISSEYLRAHGTIVVGIDTGWANTMVGATKMAKLTYDDSAARAIQPIVDDCRRSYCGKLLRNFRVVNW